MFTGTDDQAQLLRSFADLTSPVPREGLPWRSVAMLYFLDLLAEGAFLGDFSAQPPDCRPRDSVITCHLPDVSCHLSVLTELSFLGSCPRSEVVLTV